LRENLSKEEIRLLKVGFSLFSKPWVTAPSSTKRRDGLGPHFNAISCISCHHGLGRGAPPGVIQETDPALLFKVSPSSSLHEKFGVQINSRSLPNLLPEPQVVLRRKPQDAFVHDKEKAQDNAQAQYLYHLIGFPKQLVSPRIAPHLAGLGLIAEIPDQEIIENLKLSQGKIRIINNSIGRFGWKADHSTLKSQIAAAFRNDLGITNSLFPEEACSSRQQKCREAQSGDDEEGVEIRDDHLGFVVGLISSIAAPKKSANFNVRGKQIFSQISCTSCHRPNYLTKNNETISPYSDFLLHNMGKALSDGLNEKLSSYWKTPPLWGLGAIKRVNGHSRLLHDGRATSIEDAIAWHGGEAKESKNNYLRLSKEDKLALLSFLESI